MVLNLTTMWGILACQLLSCITSFYLRFILDDSQCNVYMEKSSDEHLKSWDQVWGNWCSEMVHSNLAKIKLDFWLESDWLSMWVGGWGCHWLLLVIWLLNHYIFAHLFWIDLFISESRHSVFVFLHNKPTSIPKSFLDFLVTILRICLHWVIYYLQPVGNQAHWIPIDGGFDNETLISALWHKLFDFLILANTKSAIVYVCIL